MRPKSTLARRKAVIEVLTAFLEAAASSDDVRHQVSAGAHAAVLWQLLAADIGSSIIDLLTGRDVRAALDATADPKKRRFVLRALLEQQEAVSSANP